MSSEMFFSSYGSTCLPRSRSSRIERSSLNGVPNRFTPFLLNTTRDFGLPTPIDWKYDCTMSVTARCLHDLRESGPPSLKPKCERFWTLPAESHPSHHSKRNPLAPQVMAATSTISHRR